VSRSARTPRSRRWTAAVVGGAATGAVLLGGGIALADGSGSDAAPATDQAPGDGGPGGERVVGTVTAVSGSSLTVTDDTGAAHELTLSDQTRYGGPGGGPDGGPGRGPDGGPGGGPGGDQGRPGPGGDAPAPPADGSAPEAPSEGGTPTAPSDAPAAPSEGDAPAAPSEGDAPAAPSEGSAADIAVGDRVEVRVSDSTAVEVHEVHAHVDGTVVSVDGTDLTVVTVPGLRVDVDAAALSDVPAVGDEVHLHGSVSEDGRTVVADADR